MRTMLGVEVRGQGLRSRLEDDIYGIFLLAVYDVQ